MSNQRKIVLEMKRLGLLDVIREIAETDKAFRAALAGWADSEAGIQFLFDLMDLGMPVGKKLQFLSDAQKDRVRELTFNMTPAQAEAFVGALKQPGKVMDSAALIQEFGLAGKDIAKIQEEARRALLADPNLATNARALTDRVRSGLGGSRVASAHQIPDARMMKDTIKRGLAQLEATEDLQHSQRIYEEWAAELRPMGFLLDGIIVRRPDEQRKFKTVREKVQQIKRMTTPGHVANATKFWQVRGIAETLADAASGLLRYLDRIQDYSDIPAKFKHGPFDVSNKHGFRQDEIAEPLKLLDLVADKIRKAGFGQILYGSVVLDTSKENFAGLYTSRDDSITLNVSAKYRFDNVHTLVHEFGHRYWHKVMSPQQREVYEDIYAGTSKTPLSLTDRETMWDALVKANLDPRRVVLDPRLKGLFRAYYKDRTGVVPLRAMGLSEEAMRRHFVAPKRRWYLLNDPKSVTDYGVTGGVGEDFAEVFAFSVLGRSLTPDAEERFRAATTPVILKTASVNDIVRRVQQVLTPDLLKPAWRKQHDSGRCDPMTGYCYVAAEALYHLLGPEYRPMFVRHEGAPHWFLLGPGGEILDPTASQFRTPVPYDQGRGKGFLTKEPSRRTREIMRRVMRVSSMLDAEVRELHIYDFDGTLFQSPDPPGDWEGWHDDPISLGEPCVPARPDESWWYPPIVQEARKSIAQPGVHAVLLTGRDDGVFRDRIHELLQGAGLLFDEVHLNPGMSTSVWKAQEVERLLEAYPSVTRVSVWDDMEKNHETIKAVTDSRGIHLLSVVPEIGPAPLAFLPAGTATERVSRHLAFRRLADRAFFRVISQRVAARALKTGRSFFEVGDQVWFGKYKNKAGLITGFGKDKRGNPTVIVEPVPKGRKQPKEMGLFRIWHRPTQDQKETVKVAATEEDLKRSALNYQRAVDQLGEAVKDHSRPEMRLWWPLLINSGRLMLNAAMELKTPPAPKAFELAARTILKPSRAPKDIAAWWEKNQRHLVYLLGVPHWPDKTAGGEELLQIGPFKVHNTIGLTGQQLIGTSKTLEKALHKMESASTPEGFRRVLYGDIFIVGQLLKGTTLAWYDTSKDTVFVRPFLGRDMDEEFRLIHELGHRYWVKFAKTEQKREWMLHHSRLGDKDVDVKLPDVGDPLPLQIKGSKVKPLVKRMDAGKYWFEVEMGGQVREFSTSIRSVYEILQKGFRHRNYPTSYSAKNHEEHFCDALALFLIGNLPNDHREVFQRIWK